MAGLVVRHNIEVAHRITTFEGKCNNIHGHSMWIELHMQGSIDAETGLVGNVDFGSLKAVFRKHLDQHFDHHCLLWAEDPLLQDATIPGVEILDYPPTVENIATDLFFTFKNMGIPVSKLKVQETHVNGAVYP